MAEAARRTTARRDLARHEHFDEISPEVGVLDEDAFDSLLGDDPDAALELLVGLNTATDETLRALAQRLSARIVIDLARSAPSTRRGPSRLRRARFDRGSGDLDVDASLDALVGARAEGRSVRADELVVAEWIRPDTAVCLLVDRSGSMHGERLATAVVVAAAVAGRAGATLSVVAFGSEAIVLSSPADPRPVEDVIVDLCRLRGTGVTDLGLALRVASQQLERMRSGRSLTILLSDCRATSGDDPTELARTIEELVVLAPADDHADAAALAAAVGARWAGLARPSDAPAALDRLLR